MSFAQVYTLEKASIQLLILVSELTVTSTVYSYIYWFYVA